MKQKNVKITVTSKQWKFLKDAFEDYVKFIKGSSTYIVCLPQICDLKDMFEDIVIEGE